MVRSTVDGSNGISEHSTVNHLMEIDTEGFIALVLEMLLNDFSSLLIRHALEAMPL